MTSTDPSPTTLAPDESILRYRSDQELEQDIVKSYAQMLAFFPDVQRYDNEQPSKVRNLFDLLRRYAPLIAADPFVAGSFIQQYMHIDTVSLDTIRNLTKLQRSLERTIYSHEEYRQWKERPPVQTPEPLLSPADIEAVQDRFREAIHRLASKPQTDLQVTGPLKVGDHVALIMTVNGFEGQYCKCTWTDSSGRVRHDAFYAGDLVTAGDVDHAMRAEK